MSVETDLQKLKDDLDCLITIQLTAGEEEDEHIAMIHQAGVDITTPHGAVSMLASTMISSLLELLAQAYNNLDDGEEETTALELWASGKHNS